MRRLLPLLIVLAAPVRAQTPTAAHVKAAEELLHLVGADSLTRNSAPFFASMKEQNPAVAEVVEGFYSKYLKWDDVKPEFVALYTSMYTEAEIRQMIAFYRTPVGTKMVALTPEITAKTMDIVQKRMMAHMPELMELISKQAPQ